MKRFGRTLKYVLCGLLAAGLLAAAPAEAGWIGFRNETNSAVVVQVSHVTPTRVQHGKAHLVYQGNVTWEWILQPGNKLIRVYDAAQPKRVLAELRLPYAGNDLFFAIQPEQAAPGAPVGVGPKVKLVPAKPPAPPGPMPSGPE